MPEPTWTDLEWTSRRLWESGFSLIPLDEKGKTLTNWRDSLQSNVSRLPLDELLQHIDNGADGLALAMGSSLNGDLYCRTFERQADYMSTVTAMGTEALPLACSFRSGEEVSVLFLIDDKSILEKFEEVAPDRFAICSQPGTIKGGLNLVRIPPTNGIKWIQEPLLKIGKPDQSNVYYYNATQVGLLPPF